MVGAFEFDDSAQLGSVKHIEHMAAVGHLHGRSVGVAVAGDYLDAIAHEFDSDFLA